MTRLRLLALALATTMLLASCGGILPPPPTPEPFVLPPSPTPVGVAPTSAVVATAAPAPTAAISATSYSVQRGDVVEALVFQGTVIASQRQDLVFTQSGQIKAITAPIQGAVKKGDLLASLDDSDLQSQLTDAQTSYDRAKSAYDRSLATASIPVRKAEIDLASARDSLDQAKRPATPEQLAGAQAAVESAEATLARTRNEASAAKNQAEVLYRDAEVALRNAQTEFGNASVDYEAHKSNPVAEERYYKAAAALQEAQKAFERTKIDFDTARNNEIALVQSASAQVKTAQVALTTLLNLPDPFVVKKAERAVALAQVAVDEARSRAVGDPILQTQLDDAKKALAEINAQLAARTLVAPFDGEIVAVIAQVGAQVQVGDPIITLLNPQISPDALEIQLLQISESTNIRPGQIVSIVLSGATDTYPGRVTRVLGDLVGGGAKIAYVSFDAQSISSKPGDEATVGIELSKRTDVLWLPSAAVRNDGRAYVLTQDGDQVKRIDIDIGVVGIDRVEILRGLTEGQAVLGA